MTTLPNDSNVLYNVYKDKTVAESNKIIYDWEEVYRCKKRVNETEANKYKASVEREIATYSLSSEYIQTQYYCSFKVRGERFVTMEDLENNNVFKGHIEENIGDYGKNPHVFRLAAYDPATTNDYAALTLGIALKYPGEERFKVSLKNCIILNRGDEKVSSDILLEKVTKICQENEIDMLMFDATAQQDTYGYYLYNKMKDIGCNTMIIPFSFAGANKQKMMLSFEDAIYDQTIVFPRKEYTEIHADYKELIDEICYLQKTVSDTGTIRYKAPDGDRFKDDLVMSVSMLNYICPYIQKMWKNKHKIDLGDGIKYYLKFHKNTQKEKSKVVKVSGNRPSYYF